MYTLQREVALLIRSRLQCGVYHIRGPKIIISLQKLWGLPYVTVWTRPQILNNKNNPNYWQGSLQEGKWDSINVNNCMHGFLGTHIMAKLFVSGNIPALYIQLWKNSAVSDTYYISSCIIIQKHNEVNNMTLAVFIL